MNVLSDILCATSPLILSSSYNGPLSSHEAHLTKQISKQNIMLSNEKDFHLLETLSNIPNLVQVPNATGVENGFFDAPESIHTSLNLVNSNYPMHQDADPSHFIGDEFHNSIPSWFPKDLIKASDSVSTNFCEDRDNSRLELLPNVRNESLTMMQLGFPHEMTSQHNTTNSMNSGYMPNNQSLLSESQVYSTADSLLMSTFTDMDSFPLPVVKMSRPCDKYDQNHLRSYSTNNSHNLMNTVLPLDNSLGIGNQDPLHLSLPNPIVDTHTLTNSVNAAIITDGQSNGHNLEVLRDKRPHISLNQLDFLLDTHSPLNDMQITSNSFAVDTISDKQSCSDFTQESVIDTCNGNLGVMSCNNGSLSNLNIHPFNEHQEIVDINSLPQLSLNSEVDPLVDEIDAAIIEIKCLKCKYCSFLSLDREQVRSHIKEVHSKPVNQPQTTAHNVLYSSNMLPVENYNTANIPVVNTVTMEASTEALLCSDRSKKICCELCALNFDTMESFTAHSVAVHGRKTLNNKTSNLNLEHVLKKLPVENIPVQDIPLQNIPVTNDHLSDYNTVIASAIVGNCHDKAVSSSSNPIEKLNTNEHLKKNASNKKSSMNEENAANTQKRVSAHKKAWQRKMKREMSSYICEFKGCNVRFHFLDNLEYHRKCHVAASGKFACPECASIFDHWGPTAGHLWRNHATDMELHACDVCNFRTYSLSRLETRHKPIHQDRFSFHCDVCKKVFKTSKQLIRHKATHTDPSISKLPKKFVCFICSRPFATKKFLRTHLLVHNKQKSFVCNVCDYSASKRSTLKLHALQHTGEKPFACTECDFRTADHNTFRRHKMKHTGEKPYKCPFCSYASIQASTYKAHIKRQHPGQEHNLMFSCTICSFRSVKQDNFIAHMADHEMEKVSRLDNNTVRPMSDSPKLQDSEVLPLVEAMDISLSHGDRSMMMPTKESIYAYLRKFNESDHLRTS